MIKTFKHLEINSLAMNEYDSIICGVSEIWTKSESVKKYLMNKLVKNLKARLKGAKFDLRRGRIIIRPYKKEFIDIVRKTFGIRFCRPCYEVNSEYEEIKSKVYELLKDFRGKVYFNVNRVWKKFPLTSIELGKKLASDLLKELKGLEFVYKNFDKEIYIEIHEDITFISDKRIECYDGFPYGTQGKILCLFSGGIDSPVAAWLLARRGLEVILLFLNLGGPVQESLVYEVYEVLKEYLPGLKVYVIDCSDLVEKIIENVRKGYRQIVYKVIMYKIAEAVAKKLGIKAIATGESLGQVSTQTFDSLTLLDSYINLPVYRPLIGFNKEEIIKIAKDIGTYEKSEKILEICVLEKHSTAAPKKEIVDKELEKLNLNIDNYVENMRLIEKKHESIEDYIPRNVPRDKLVIVDLKKEKIDKLEKDKAYLFLCPRGITALNYAIKYREEGFECYALDYKTAKRLGFIK